ncbi:hypothetical protein Vretifemale_18491 [Volvox reticuliferus]|uniref:Uncharacterized protein n=1 Tax=Volvox reticuliferus TaxID=1737510 RepID=A0A8J4FZN9_9CHLO|nr:hypothetical protein Vretifemale_18491 [Volvox reticuliferus]
MPPAVQDEQILPRAQLLIAAAGLPDRIRQDGQLLLPFWASCAAAALRAPMSPRYVAREIIFIIVSVMVCVLTASTRDSRSFLVCDLAATTTSTATVVAVAAPRPVSPHVAVHPHNAQDHVRRGQVKTLHVTCGRPRWRL